MIACSVVAIFTTVGIIFALVFEAYRFFQIVPFTEFLFGTNWEPQIPIREDQIAAEGAFGWLPVIIGTLVISFVAMFIATPVGLLSAIYLNEFAPKTVRAVVKPVLEILSGRADRGLRIFRHSRRGARVARHRGGSRHRHLVQHRACGGRGYGDHADSRSSPPSPMTPCRRCRAVCGTARSRWVRRGARRCARCCSLRPFRASWAAFCWPSAGPLVKP